MSLSPLLAIGALSVSGRAVRHEYMLLSVALSMSWVGDSVQHYIGGSFAAGSFWLPFQIGIAWFALLGRGLRTLALWGVAGLTALSFSVSFPSPDWVLTLGGSIGLLLAANHRGKIALPVFIYFGLGSCFYLMLVMRIGVIGMALPWYAYQGCRLAAIVTLIVLMAQTSKAEKG